MNMKHCNTSAHAEEWRWEMRREMQEIIPGLWLGPYWCARNLDELMKHTMTHLLCIRDVTETHIIKQHFPTHFIYYTLQVSDEGDANLIPHFQQATLFIHNCLTKGGRVFVHCNSGISRSPAVVIAYMMEYRKMSYEEAFSFVMSKRFCINPNDCFKFQLKGYEPILEARKITENEHQMNYQFVDDDSRGKKRSFRDTEEMSE